MEKICLTCGKKFAVPAWRKGKVETCSRKCRGVRMAESYSAQRVELECKGCGKKFKVPPSHADRRIYCSEKCAAPSRNTAATHPRGVEHYLWKGGKTYHSAGYLYLAMPGHPFGTNGDYVFEHRVVMESLMREVAPDHHFLVAVGGGLFLKPGIDVHHINGIKSDNRIKNLLACTDTAHFDIHRGKSPRVGEVWPEIDGLLPFSPRKVPRVCETCGTEFIAKLSDVGRGGGKFCTRLCFNKRVR